MKNMKNVILIVLSMLALSAAVVVFVLSDNEKPEPVEKRCIISFDPAGGDIVGDLEYEENMEIKLPTPYKEGHTFVTWEDKNGMPITSGVILACEEVTLTAKWEKESACMIIFDTDGGNNIPNMAFDQNKQIELPTPEKEGYKFVVWEDKNGMPITSGVKFECAHVTLKAKWEQ